MKLAIERYLEQERQWPQHGCHILAQFDETSIVVYQAYRSSIGHFAAQHGYFGDSFSLERMSWIKPNFLWMMYRNGWGQKEGQEVTLAIRIKRTAFDGLIAQAVPSAYGEGPYATPAEWKKAVVRSDVRLQWDPDHSPSGNKLERRAIQLGLRGPVLEHYAHEWLLDIEDISDFVREQHQHVLSQHYDLLFTPRERVYPYQK